MAVAAYSANQPSLPVQEARVSLVSNLQLNLNRQRSRACLEQRNQLLQVALVLLCLAGLQCRTPPHSPLCLQNPRLQPEVVFLETQTRRCRQLPVSTWEVSATPTLLADSPAFLEHPRLKIHPVVACLDQLPSLPPRLQEVYSVNLNQLLQEEVYSEVAPVCLRNQADFSVAQRQ